MKFDAKKLKAISRQMTNEEKEKMDYRIKNANWLELSAIIALNIRKILRSQGLSQIAFAEKMGVTPAQVSKLLSGKTNLELKTIAKIQDILGEPILDNLYPKKEQSPQIIVFANLSNMPIRITSKVCSDASINICNTMI